MIERILRITDVDGDQLTASRVQDHGKHALIGVDTGEGSKVYLSPDAISSLAAWLLEEHRRLSNELLPLGGGAQ